MVDRVQGRTSEVLERVVGRPAGSELTLSHRGLNLNHCPYQGSDIIQMIKVTLKETIFNVSQTVLSSEVD